MTEKNTGWTSGTLTWRHSVFVPSVRIGGQTVKDIPEPVDYRLAISDQVVDTSSTIYGAPASPMKFSVRNLSQSRKSDVLFVDFDGDQAISPRDNVIILEPDEQSELRLTWQVLFTIAADDSSPQAPQAGDEFVINTLKPFTSADVFEFRTVLTSVHDPGSAALPGALTLFSNYPNPLNPATTIRYGLPQAANVTLRVHNLLGEEVVTLVDGESKVGG